MAEKRVVLLLEMESDEYPGWEPAGKIDSGLEVDAIAAARRVSKKYECRVRAVRREVLWDSDEDGGPSSGTDLPPAGMMELWLDQVAAAVEASP